MHSNTILNFILENKLNWYCAIALKIYINEESKRTSQTKTKKNIKENGQNKIITEQHSLESKGERAKESRRRKLW